VHSKFEIAEANTAYVANETNEHSPLQKHRARCAFRFALDMRLS